MMSRPLQSVPMPRAFLRSSKPHTAYQVDYAAVNCGRIVAASKRHIRFKFGFTNMEALSNGKTGQDCRGSEHEVSVTWSLSSGKQAVAFDQHELFFDVGDSTQTKLSHSWKDKRGHNLEVKIHAANVSTKSKPDPDWKQYDLVVNGVSFFHMPKIFEIGVFPKDDVMPVFGQGLKFDRHPSGVRPNAQAGGSGNVPKINMESILPPDEPKKQQEPEVADLLSFDDFDDPAPAVVAPVAPPPMQTAPAQTEHAPARVQFQNNHALSQTQAQDSYSFAQATELTNSAPTAPAQTNIAYAQAPVKANYTHAQQTYEPSSNLFPDSGAQDRDGANCVSPITNPGQLGNSHCLPNQDAPTILASGAPNNPYTETSSVASTSPQYVPHPNPVTPQVSSTPLIPAQRAPNNINVDGAMKNLVNMDDLFGTPPAPVTKESIDAKIQDLNAHKSLGQLKGGNSRNSKSPVMNPFNPAPVSEHQGTIGYAAQQQQCNNHCHQQSYSQAGFGYQ